MIFKIYEKLAKYRLLGSKTVWDDPLSKFQKVIIIEYCYLYFNPAICRSKPCQKDTSFFYEKLSFEKYFEQDFESQILF